ncbi:hypothetical protein LCGC14_2444660 [marine sediment metagenome]|uniref:Uncharacterized protein n=1 Tax=marine sediment metagenome TaxID=412755 RepID=A0A0F9BI54_9ZZZZ
MSDSELEKARAAKAEAKLLLQGVKETNGIGIGLGIGRKGPRYIVKINFTEAPDIVVPDKINGVEVVVNIVGHIKKRRKE